MYFGWHKSNPKPMKLLNCCLILLGLATLAQAQHQGNAAQGNRPNYAYNQAASSPNQGFVNDSTLILEARVLFNAPAKSYQAVFSVTQVGESLEEAQKLLSRRLQQFTKALTDLGIAPTDIYPDFVFQVPVYAFETEKRLFSKSYNEVPTGVRLQKNLHIGYVKEEWLEKIMEEAAKAEIYDLAKVQYLVADQRAVTDTLRQVALRVISKKNKELRSIGVKFNAKYQTVADQLTVYQPAERYESYTAYSAAQLGNQRRGATVNEVEKTVTRYYSPMASEGYDWVENPSPLAPTVQFVYILRVKYVLKREQ